MATVITAPEEYVGSGRSLFLAGGISDAEDWQARMIGLLAGLPIVVLNPRRASFPMDDPAEGRRQIEWEHRHLRRAWAVAFWFPPQTLCPIALFELGGRLETQQPLFVGADPAYRRRFDVEVQVALSRPEIAIVDSIESLARQVNEHVAASAAAP